MKNYLKSEANNRNENQVLYPDSKNPDKIINDAGGYVFEATDNDKLMRFLVIGTNDSFYRSGEFNSKKYYDYVLDMVSNNEDVVFDAVNKVVSGNLAKSKTPTIFTIAVLMNYAKDKAKARELASQYIKTSTDLFSWIDFVKNTKSSYGSGMGRAKRRVIQEFYDMSDDSLAYQMVKYRSREGWSHKDVMRVGHPFLKNKELAQFALGNDFNVNEVPSIVQGFTKMSSAKNIEDVLDILDEYKNLPWETVPTEFLKEFDVWNKLLENNAIPQVAMVRKLKVFIDNRFFHKSATFRREVESKIVDGAKNRPLHPMNYFLAFSNLTYNVLNVPTSTLDALEEAFELSFKSVPSLGEKMKICVDVSGSMVWNNSHIQALAAGLVLLKQEPSSEFYTFSDSESKSNITPSTSIQDALKSKFNSAGTNIGSVIKGAIDDNKFYDSFVILTDSDVNYGHRVDNLINQYREKVNPNAKIITIAQVTNEFSLTSGDDDKSLNIAGIRPDSIQAVNYFISE